MESSGSTLLRFALVLAGSSVVVGIAALGLSSSAAHVVGYAFCSVVPFVLIALERRASVAQEAIHGIAPPRYERRLVYVILFVGLAGAIANAWVFAWGIS